MRTPAPWCMYTGSSHREPRKARGPPEGGSGQTPRHSSVAGTAPTWPAGKEAPQHGPRVVGPALAIGSRSSEDGTKGN